MQLSRSLVSLVLVAGTLASPSRVSREIPHDLLLSLAGRSEGACSTGPVQCCNSVQPASSPAASEALKTLLNVVVQDLDVPIGLTCTPISLLGIGSGANCASTPVCCDQNHQNGAVNIGCLPVVAQL